MDDGDLGVTHQGMTGLGLKWLRRGIAALAIAALAGCQTAPSGSAGRVAPLVAAGPVQSAQDVAVLPDTPATPGSVLAASAVTTAPRAPGPASLALAPSGGAVARAHSAIVIDARSGQVLHEENADGLRNPASLTKMMTLYLLFDALDAGIVKLDSPLKVSRKAASQPPARIGVKAGTTITVDQAIRALAVKSANDVAVVVAENIGGTETAFAHRMTRKARSLGMRRTNFVNASGLENPGQVTSARDMATLARALKRHHASRARNFTARSFTYKGRTYKTTNNLLGRVAGVDGIKTGYISIAGYNLAASARRGGKSIIAVVIGGKTEARRDREVTNLLERYL